jgi:RimJ/RimL family protein N-acetyltransferase
VLFVYQSSFSGSEVGEMVEIETGAAGQTRLACLESSDGPELLRFFYRLSPETLYRRFHSPLTRPEQAQPARLLDIDHHDREAVVAVLDGEIVGVARYARRSGDDTAEVAVVVADDWQRQGLATRMLGALTQLAEPAGIRHFTLSMQADNRAALGLLRRFRPDAALTHSQGIYEAKVPVGSSQSWA